MADAPRRTRRDALENRARLLEVAAQAFAEHGLATAPAAIAKKAGVGVGTLYRHFPTREALIDAAYRHQLAAVCERAPALLAEHPAEEAFRRWLTGFLDYVRAKHGMSEALNAVIASGVDPYSDSRTMLLHAIGTFQAADGALRADVPSEDVLLLIGGVAYSAQHCEEPQASRLIDLVLAALAR
ncbi:TetR/AcrR family transcriptional regulator [Amycolatopsis benzoatilytica]|uniref:TetR/AcrR family transcriptional regulator n=1 Tax=Amycolatopsis benzoatilytica TaxID=346045 RepID=UPI000379FE86|nr:TetR family transcriptional regulator [Amycolatopsis benzoatilytica]